MVTLIQVKVAAMRDVLCEITVTFLQISHKPQLRSQKPMNRRFQQYIVHSEILSTFHTQVKYKNTLKNAIQITGEKPPIPPIPIKECGPQLIYPSHSPPQTSA